MPITQQTEPGKPVWQIAELFPRQGEWSEGDYLRLDTNRLIELCDGSLEFPPMPTELHQLLALFLYRQLAAFCDASGAGIAMAAPFRVRVGPERFREPDVMFLSRQRFSLRESNHWRGADLVMEVISEDDPGRDWITKRTEYAAAPIDEYWLVDPRDRSVTILSLEASTGHYQQVARCHSGDVARSQRLDGFSIDVAELFAKGAEEV